MFKRYFITGLLVWVPVVITLWVLNLIFSTLDRVVPESFTAQALLGQHIPGFGIVLVLSVVFLTGLTTANILGSKLLNAWEVLLSRIPLVRSIYQSVKQVSDTILSPNGQAFRKAVLIQYPRANCWTIAFLTGTPGGDVVHYLPSDCVSVYIPTTPNPTSGFFLMLPRADVVELDITVDAALKYIVSMGVVAPSEHPIK